MKKIKNIFRIIKEASLKTKKRKIIICLDIIKCHFKYKASLFDYDFFEMYKLTDFERNTIITKGVNNEYIKKYNNPKYIKNFNEMIFKKTFDKYLKQDVKKIKQCNVLNELNPNSLSTILVVTILGQVTVAYLITYGNKKLVAPIDIETGIITHPACDRNKNAFENHPITNKNIKGLKIPNWEEIIKICEQASIEVAAIGYASWEICVEENKCFLLNGNVKPNYVYYNLPIHRNNNIGLLPVFKQKEERKIK